MTLNLLTPPFAWLFLVLVVYGVFTAVGGLQPRRHTVNSNASSNYACGEKDPGIDHRPFTGLNPEYTAFLSSLLFFVVTEVAVLLLITLPAGGKIPWSAFALLGVILLCSAGLLGEIQGSRR